MPKRQRPGAISAIVAAVMARMAGPRVNTLVTAHVIDSSGSQPAHNASGPNPSLADTSPVHASV